MNAPITIRLPEIELTEAEILANLVYPADPPGPRDAEAGQSQ